MTREEAIAAGVEVYDTQHSMKRRTPWHDYSRKGTYMLTLVVRERMPLLGTLSGCLEGDIPPYVVLSALGNAIAQEEQNLKSATIIQCTIKGRFEESLVATFSKKPQHNINM